MAEWSDDHGNGPGLVVPAGGGWALGRALEKVRGVLRGTGVRGGLLVVAGSAVTWPVRKVEL